MAALIFRCLKCPRLGWTGQPFTCVLGAGSRLTGETGDPIVLNDPCDRIIIATALLNAMKIVTCDTLISQYEGVEVVW